MGEPLWTVEAHAHGLVVRGTVPALALVDVIEMARLQGYDLVDTDLTQRLGCLLVLVSHESGARWRAELDGGET